jgi:hypothetical protein
MVLYGKQNQKSLGELNLFPGKTDNMTGEHFLANELQ